jgi:flavorubredoxin
VKEDKTIFTCDFLGAHYCEPNMIDTEVTYLDAYKTAIKLYYDVIFSPFKRYANEGLDKISQLDCEFICTSHGPVLTKHGLFKYVFDRYRE